MATLYIYGEEIRWESESDSEAAEKNESGSERGAVGNNVTVRKKKDRKKIMCFFIQSYCETGRLKTDVNTNKQQHQINKATVRQQETAKEFNVIWVVDLGMSAKTQKKLARTHPKETNISTCSRQSVKQEKTFDVHKRTEERQFLDYQTVSIHFERVLRLSRLWYALASTQMQQ